MSTHIVIDINMDRMAMAQRAGDKDTAAAVVERAMRDSLTGGQQFVLWTSTGWNVGSLTWEHQADHVEVHL